MAPAVDDTGEGFGGERVGRRRSSPCDRLTREERTRVACGAKGFCLGLRTRALVPVHLQMEQRIVRDLIEAIYRATSFDPDRL